MPRYIDADALMRLIPMEELVARMAIANAPTANVRENVHAKFVSEIIKKEDWKGRTQSYYQSNSCSNCHTALTGKENFCPNCGAEMEKGESDDRSMPV